MTSAIKQALIGKIFRASGLADGGVDKNDVNWIIARNYQYDSDYEEE